ncbi:hypothetical protein Tco_0497531 [Tanacetum coccineum]
MISTLAGKLRCLPARGRIESEFPKVATDLQLSSQTPSSNKTIWDIAVYCPSKLKYLNLSSKLLGAPHDLVKGKGDLLLIQGFLTAYGIPSEYKVMLPKSNQTIYDALDGFVGLSLLAVPNLPLLPSYARNIVDKRSFKDKIPPSIRENPLYQCLGRHPINVRTFPDPILFLAGLKPSWEHGQQRPVIFVYGKEMAFRNFMFAKDDGDLSFLPREPSSGFGTGSSLLINNEPPLLEAEPLDSANSEQLVENTANSEGSPAREEMLLIGTGSVAWRMKDRKCLPDTPELQTTIDFHLMISNVIPPFWRVHLDNHLDVELHDFHDHCYAKQGVVDNAVNRRARELLSVIEQMTGECDVLKEREKSRDKKCEELKAKCEVGMADFDNNHAVNVLRQKIKSLSKRRLEATEATLCQEVKAIKGDRAEVVSKVVPYIAMELVHSDEMDMLVGKLVSSTIFYGRCAAFVEVAGMKEPFDLAKVKGYRTHIRKSMQRREMTLLLLPSHSYQKS